MCIRDRLGGFQVERCPVYENFTSVLSHFPSTSFRLKGKDHVPQFVSREYRAPVHDPARSVTVRPRTECVGVTGSSSAREACSLATSLSSWSSLQDNLLSVQHLLMLRHMTSRSLLRAQSEHNPTIERGRHRQIHTAQSTRLQLSHQASNISEAFVMSAPVFLRSAISVG